MRLSDNNQQVQKPAQKPGETLIVRARAPAGQFRLSLNSNTLYVDLLKQVRMVRNLKISEQTGIPVKGVKVFTDQKMRKSVRHTKTTTLGRLGWRYPTSP